MTEKSRKVNESQIDFLGLPAEEGLPRTHVDCERLREGRITELKPCPFCKHTTLLELYSKDRQRVAEYLWDVLLNDLYEIAQDTEDVKEIWVLDHRVRNFIRKTRVKGYEKRE